MGDQSRSFEMAISWGDDLINVLYDTKGFDLLAQTLEHLRAIHFSCDEDVYACKGKTHEANSWIADGEEIERLQRELDEEIKLECKLKDELRFMAEELKDVKNKD